LPSKKNAWEKGKNGNRQNAEIWKQRTHLYSEGKAIHRNHAEKKMDGLLAMKGVLGRKGKRKDSEREPAPGGNNI